MQTADIASTAARDRLGTVVAGRYELTRLLGSGGMGTVFEARHTFTERRVALKLLRPEFATSPEAATRFLREARASATVGHPNIVEVLDAGADTDGMLYLALELLEGETLQSALAAGRMTPAQIVRVALALLDALGAAHRRGLVHRDVKPANIFLVAGTPSRVKLLDFGIARKITAESEVTAVGAAVGSRDYMSPEQALGASVDGRTDLWSLGATLFVALTGRTPLPQSDARGFLAAFLHEPVPSLASVRDDLPAALVEAVDGALQKNPEERWPHAEAMAEPLRAALSALGDAEPIVSAAMPPRAQRQSVTPTSETLAPVFADPSMTASTAPGASTRPPGIPRERPARPSRRFAIAAGLTLAVAGAAAWAYTQTRPSTTGTPTATTTTSLRPGPPLAGHEAAPAAPVAAPVATPAAPVATPAAPVATSAALVAAPSDSSEISAADRAEAAPRHTPRSARGTRSRHAARHVTPTAPATRRRPTDIMYSYP